LLQAIIYHSSPDAPQVADKIAEDYNVRSKAYQADTSDQKKMHEIVKQVYDDLGPVGGIVCNAGRASQKPALEATREDFDACFDTNVWGAFVSAQACAALWKEHGYQNGKVVIVSCESVSVLVARGVYRQDSRADNAVFVWSSHLGFDRQQGKPAVFLQRLQGEFWSRPPSFHHVLLMNLLSQPS
jgi:NAD(P)-dependent dehydrogenase (short-subunit alcohol dehydrogenase family)